MPESRVAGMLVAVPAVPRLAVSGQTAAAGEAFGALLSVVEALERLVQHICFRRAQFVGEGVKKFDHRRVGADVDLKRPLLGSCHPCSIYGIQRPGQFLFASP